MSSGGAASGSASAAAPASGGAKEAQESKREDFSAVLERELPVAAAEAQVRSRIDALGIHVGCEVCDGIRKCVHHGIE